MSYIDNNFIDNLVESADIVDVVSRRVSLKKSGSGYQACCPFHTEKTPSFSVSPSKQLFKCFGCGVAGGVLKFIQEYDHLDFVASIETLASEMNQKVVYEKNDYSPQENARLSAELEHKKNLKTLMAQVARYYEQQLRSHPVKDKVIHYMRGRKLTGVIAKRFNMGYAPPDVKDLLAHFPIEQHPQLVELGVLGQNEGKTNQYYARFRDRLMFPIHNNKAETIAFGARALAADVKPKYLNSPETPIFGKSKELYGFYHCRKYSKDLNHILVVEGYMDVVSLHQYEVTNVVATLGTATSEAHLTLLSRSTKNIIFCFDGDAAGKKAAWRALEISLSWLKKGMKVNFLFLPDEQDPDTLVQKEGKNNFLARIDKALSLSTYLFEHLKSQVDFNSGEGKTEFIEAACEQLAKINYQTYQEQLILSLVELSQSNIESINAKVMQYQDKIQIRQNQGKQNEKILTTNKLDNNETGLNPTLKNAIHLLLHYPNIASSINQETLKKIQSFANGNILYQLINDIDYDNQHQINDINLLIKPFSGQPYFAQLETLIQLQPIIKDEVNARIGLMENINMLEMQMLVKDFEQLKQKSNKTDADHQAIMQLIQRLQQLKTLKA